MLKILLSQDWRQATAHLLRQMRHDVEQKLPNRLVIVPELVSHDMEKNLCRAAGDTASRYAEVLSFKRLARSVSETLRCSDLAYLDNGGRIVAMASATRQLHSVLKSYAAVETNPEFLAGLVQAVDEFKRCCVSAADLMRASKQTQGSFAQKLEELALIYEAYDSICARGRRDPRDQMNWLLEMLEGSTFAQDHVFYLIDFPDFSRQNLQIVAHLIENSPNVTVYLNCDQPGSGKLAFEKAGQTAMELIRIAKSAQISYEVVSLPVKISPTQRLCDSLLQGKLEAANDEDFVSVYSCIGVYDECLRATEKVLQLVHSGARYRDIRLVCSDLNLYHSSLQMLFQKAGIPFYLSGTEQITDNAVIQTLLGAMNTALSGFTQRSVLRYLKSMLSPLTPRQCDLIENYVTLWSIQGNMWTTPWTQNPYGLGKEMTAKAQMKLQQLNQWREKAMQPLIRLRDGFKNAPDLSRQLQALYRFMEQIQLQSKMQKLSDELLAAHDSRGAQILQQLWDILVDAMDQLHDMLGATSWDAETFTRLFTLLLGQYDVGTIPTVLDAVTFGPVSAMRCVESDHLIVLGADEGRFPPYGANGGILTDLERKQLQQMDIPLNSGSIDGLQTAFSEIYDVFCGTRKSVYVSFSSSQPSFIINRLAQRYGMKSFEDPALGAALADPMEAGAYLARFDAEEEARQLGLEHIYQQVYSSTSYSLGSVQPKHIEDLYGKQITLSATKIDQLAKCRLAYFLRYGLNASVLEPARISPAEFGTYVHAVLEELGRQVAAMGGFREVTLEQTLEIAAQESAKYFQEHFHELGSERLAYYFQKNSKELAMIVAELWQEMRHSLFSATDFEVGFGPRESMSAVPIRSDKLDAALEGYVDRVDTWQDGKNNYFRVVDYKTGKKDFDFCDVLNGIGLQMLLYLYALEDEGQEILGEDPISAGVLYFPARAPMLKLDYMPTDAQVDVNRSKAWIRNGLVLGEDRVLEAMQDGTQPNILPCEKDKSGNLKGNAATRQQFGKLRHYLNDLLKGMVDEIAEGKVDPNPYTRDANDNACQFCPYGTICREQADEGRRVFRAVNADAFWKQVEEGRYPNG